MEEKLNIKQKVTFDNSIANYEIHAHQPYATSSFKNSDEIHIAIQHQDQCILPSRSSLHIQGKLSKEDGTKHEKISLVNNAIAFLFSEIRYELNGEVIDKCKNVGITTLMKGYPSFTPNQMKQLENAGWKFDDKSKITDEEGYFDVLLPLIQYLDLLKIIMLLLDSNMILFVYGQILMIMLLFWIKQLKKEMKNIN